VTDPAVRRVLAGVHIAVGGLYVLLFAGHLVVSRNGRHRGEKGRGAPLPRPGARP